MNLNITLEPLIKFLYFSLRKFLLQSVEPFLSIRNKRSDIRDVIPERILFIRTDRIGDMVLSTPALQALKIKYPNSHLTVMASKSNNQILLNNPYVDQVIVKDLGSIRAPLAFIKWLASIRKTHYNIVIDPMAGYDLKTAIIAYLINAGTRIGFPGYGREVFYSRAASAVDDRMHIVDLTLSLVEIQGCGNGSISPRIFLSHHELDWAESWLKQHNHSDKSLLGIHPGGYYETQRWPTAHYATLLKMLSNRNQKVVLLGGLADNKLVSEITALSGENPLIFVSSDLRKTMALMSRLKLIICNNSGPLHIASALNLPTVSFMGPTNEIRWIPIGKQHTILKVDGLECLGCEQGKCPKGSIDCMRRILPSEAFNSINKMLNTR